MTDEDTEQAPRSERSAAGFSGAGVAVGPVAFVGAMILLAFGGFVVDRHARSYLAAGVAPPEAWAGAIAAQVIVLAVVGILVIMAARLDELFVIWPVTIAVSVGFAVLPPLVHHDGGWVAVVLSVAITLVFNAVAGAYEWLMLDALRMAARSG